MKRRFFDISFRSAMIAALCLAAHATTVSATVIVAENFGGGASDLDGKDADTFDAAITNAGGSATWDASIDFDRDGSVTGSGNRSAHLGLGSYINDHKGDSNGWFALTMTISEVTGDNNNDLMALGFSSSASAPSIGNDFVGASGVGTIAYRRSGELDMWAGPGTDNPVDGPDGNSGARTLTATLDLTPDGGYDGAADFGTVTWSDSVLGHLGNHTYTSDTDFNWILLSARSAPVGTNSSLTLEQFSANYPKAQNPSGDVFVRSAAAERDSNFNNHELLVGRVGGNDWCRGLLEFDLSSIPDTATIRSASLDLFIDTLDSGPSVAKDNTLTVRQLTQDFTESATYNKYDGSSDWATAGGDFDSTNLSSLDFSDAEDTSPHEVSPGQQFSFPSSAAFASAVQSNLADNVIGLIVQIPGLEGSYNQRNLFRFGSSENNNASHRPVLTVRYSWIPRGTVVSIN